MGRTRKAYLQLGQTLRGYSTLSTFVHICFFVVLWLSTGFGLSSSLLSAQTSSTPINDLEDMTVGIDTFAEHLTHFHYTAVKDSCPIVDSLNTSLSIPYPLYRSLFNQARIRHTTATKDVLSPRDSLLLEMVLQDTLLQRIDRRVEYDIQVPHPQPKSDIPMFSLLLGVLSLFAYTRHRYEGYINPAIQAYYNVSLARQFYTDFGLNNSGASSILSINTICILGSILFLSFDKLNIATPFPDALLLGVCLLAMGILFTAKRTALRLLANIALPTYEVVYFYLFNRDIILNVTTTALLPLPIIAAFARPELALWAWLMAVVVIGLMFFYNYYRGLQVIKDFVWYHKFHFLLYLCAFEIAPLLIIIKLLRS